MRQTFLFYDIETSGLNKAFDQVLQFAAIRTDETLTPIEQFDWTVRLSRDTLIDPDALLVHGVGPSQCANGLLEYEAIQRIHALFNTPGTISIGYNTLGFDDEFLRFSFYRHLLTPYTHQFANHCGRADLYPMVVLYYLFRQDALIWPTVKNRISFKLEDLNAANDLDSGRAHTALADVKASLVLAQKLYEDRSLWQYCLGYFNKVTDKERQSALPCVAHQPPGKVGLYIDGSLGFERQYHTVVWSLGRHRVFRNQSLWLRVSPDLPTVLEADDPIEAISAFVLRKKDAEPGFIVPFNRIHKITTPVVQAKIDEILNWCENNLPFLQAIEKHFSVLTYPEVPNCDASAALYQLDFPSETLLKQQQLFWQNSWEARVVHLVDWPQPYRQLVERLIWRYQPHLLNQASSFLQSYLWALQGQDAGLLDYRNRSFRTLNAVLARLAVLHEGASEDQKSLLQSYCHWLRLTWEGG